MGTNPPLPVMNLKEVAEALNVTESAIRARMCRKAAGRSAPHFPEPLGKSSGAWFWDRRAMAKFVNTEKASKGKVLAAS